jgi:hypothetical protein
MAKDIASATPAEHLPRLFNRPDQLLHCVERRNRALGRARFEG